MTALALAQLHGDFSPARRGKPDLLDDGAGAGVFAALCIRTAAETFALPRWAQALLFAAAAGLTALYRAYLTQSDSMVSTSG
jgi:hypothetical protein